jgi:hypothetical protein
MRQAVEIGGRPGIPFRHAAFQSQVVSHPKKPTSQIGARFVLSQMAEQRQEHLLNNFLTIVLWQSKCRQVPQQRAPPLFEKRGDIFL